MKIKVETLTQKHIDDLKFRLDPKQGELRDAMLTNTDYLKIVRAGGPTCAFLVDDEVMAVAGLIDYVGTGRAILWCAFADDCKEYFTQLFRRMKRTLEYFPRRRLEAIIDKDFEAGKRFARLGGFKFEAIKEAYNFNGTDAEEWVYINRGAA